MVNNEYEVIFCIDKFYYLSKKRGAAYSNNASHFQLEKGVDGLFGSFARLDSRISSVGQTAAKIGDHLQVKLSYALLHYALDP